MSDELPEVPEGFFVPDDLAALFGDDDLDQLPSQAGVVKVLASVDLLVPGSPYVPEVQPSDDVTIRLPGDKAVAYALAVLAAAHRAHYAAAVLAQMRVMLGRSGTRPMAREEVESNARFVLDELIKDLPELGDEATAPLRFRPVVMKDGRAKVRVSLPPHDEPLFGWTFEEACHHAHGVLDQVLVSPLDTAYRNTMSVLFGFGEQKGRAFVGTLGEYYEQRPGVPFSSPEPAERVPFVKPPPRVPGPPPGARAGKKRRRR